VELVVGGPAEDDVVGALEGHNFKRDFLFAEIVNIAKSHGKCLLSNYDDTKRNFMINLVRE
jgi:hypothetical protein